MTNKTFYLCKGFQTQINPTKPIIFYHIPKCAGTTFSVVFSYLLKNIWRIPGSLSGERGNSVAYDYFLKHKEKILKSEPGFIYGHMPYEISPNFSEHLSLTFIRDPIKRCASHLNFIISRGWLESSKSLGKLDLELCFKNEIIPDNIITRQFCGNYKKNSLIGEQDYESAMLTLNEKIDYVCDTENSLDMYNHIVSLYDLPNIFFQNEQESQKKHFEINDENHKILIKYNEYDLKIYENLKKNKKLFKRAHNREPRKNDKYFFSSPSLMINKKKHHFLNKVQFKEIYKKLENNKFSIIKD